MRGRDWRGPMALPIAAPMEPASAQQRLENVHNAITRAAALARREPDDVTLIAVSKTHGADAIVPLIEAGQRHFGENRIQEAEAKWPNLKARWPDLKLH